MRKFYQREQLNNHMETHEEPLACPWPKCERKVNRQALSNHIRQHKVDSSLKCYACDKLFNTKSQLMAHVEVHNTADQNAKQILATANSNVSKVGRLGPIGAGQTKPRTGQIQVNTTPSVQQPVETTLISITTAPSANKQRTYGNRSLSNSANKLNSAPGKQTGAGSTVKAVGSGAPKLSCYTCNQIFANHAELSEHKCSIPVVTITKEISNMLNNKQIDLSDNNQNEQHQLIFTAEKLNGNEASPCYIMTDGSQLIDSSGLKHVILQPATANHTVANLEEKNKKISIPSVSTSSSSHNRFMESNKKTYDFQNRAKKTYSSLKNKQANTAASAGQLLNDSLALKSNLADSGQQQQIFIETQSPINSQTQLILTDTNQLAALNSGGNIELDSNTAATIQALIQDNQIIQTGNEVLQIPLDQHSGIMQEQQQIVVTTTANSTVGTVLNSSATGSQLMDPAVLNQQMVATTQPIQEQTQTVSTTPAEQPIADTNQYIMIQQPDGHCVQICIPEGMDVDEVIKNLNFTWQGGDEQTVSVAGDQTAQFLDSQQILEQQQLIADQQNQLIAAEQQAVQQIGLDQSTVEQLQSGEQQVIYLPVNEDGACVLDAESLQAMLATNGEIPIIVSSNN